MDGFCDILFQREGSRKSRIRGHPWRDAGILLTPGPAIHGGALAGQE